MRNRLATLYAKYDLPSLGADMQGELGVRLGQHQYAHQWPDIMRKLELRDVLDSVTCRFRTIAYIGDAKRLATLRADFVEKARQIFADEQVRYRIDDQGGVHFALDTEFERMRVSTIGALSASRYQAVRHAFDEAFAALDRSPPDGKAGIRSAFFALEGLYRLIFPSAHQLSSSEVQKHLRPFVERRYQNQVPAIYLAQKQVASLMDWIDGVHFYRHEPGTEEPSQPPLELAIYGISQAGGHIRWLAQLDQDGAGR
jgi:hypothetical protein